MIKGTESQTSETGPGRAGWMVNALTFFGTLTALAQAGFGLPGPLIVPAVGFSMSAVWLLWFRFKSNEQQRLHWAHVVPTVGLAAAVFLAANTGFIFYQLGSAIARDEAAAATTLTEAANAAVKEERDDLKVTNDDLREEVKNLQETPDAAVPQPSAGPTESASAPTMNTPTSSPDAQVGASEVYELDFETGTYRDFDTRDSSTQASPEYEVRLQYGNLYFGEGQGTWRDVVVVYIPSRSASKDGCERGTKLKQKSVAILDLEQDESICVSTSQARWAVLTLLPDDHVGGPRSSWPFRVQMF